MPFLAYIAGLVVFVALDAVWLILMGPSYRAVMGDMLAPMLRWEPAAAFYLLDTLGLLIFVARPGTRQGAAWVAAHGALFGLFTYAAYDLTSYAVLRNWDLTMTIEDVVWGMVLSTIVSLVVWSLMRERGRRRRKG
jgi:uncharacterized membrane protein